MSAWSCAWLSGAAFLIALSLTVLLRRAALKAGMLDQPNARSSHAVPVPRGGGLSLVAVGLGAAVLPGCTLPPLQQRYL